MSLRWRPVLPEYGIAGQGIQTEADAVPADHPYRVQLSTSNGVQADSGVVDADVFHSLQLARAFGENDPLKIIARPKSRSWCGMRTRSPSDSISACLPHWLNLT